MAFEAPPTNVREFEWKWREWLNLFYNYVVNNVGTDFFFNVAAGRVDGHTPRDVVNHSTGITTTLYTIWEEPLLYTFSSSADINTISSDNAADTHDITVAGLDINYNIISETITLQGQTPVTLANSYFRINDVLNNSGTATQGEIYVWVSGGGATAGVPNTAADIRARITLTSGVSNERSVGAVRTVPAGKTGYMVFSRVGVTDNKALELTVWTRKAGGVFQIRYHIDMKNIDVDFAWKMPIKIDEKSDIDIRATIDAGTAEVSASYDYIVVDAVE